MIKTLVAQPFWSAVASAARPSRRSLSEGGTPLWDDAIRTDRCSSYYGASYQKWGRSEAHPSEELDLDASRHYACLWERRAVPKRRRRFALPAQSKFNRADGIADDFGSVARITGGQPPVFLQETWRVIGSIFPASHRLRTLDW